MSDVAYAAFLQIWLIMDRSNIADPISQPIRRFSLGYKSCFMVVGKIRFFPRAWFSASKTADNGANWSTPTNSPHSFRVEGVAFGTSEDS